MGEERRLLQKMGLGVLLVVLLFSSSLEGNRVSLASPSASVAIIEPDGVGDEVRESDDYATTVLGDPWDMNEYSDLARETEMAWGSISLWDGIWRGITADHDPSIWLINMGYPSAQAIGKMGRVYPIETARYRRLSFRIYSSKGNDGVQLFWFTGWDWIPVGVSTWIDFDEPGWHTITVDLADLPALSGTWLGHSEVTGLRLDPISSGSGGEEIGFDWIRLTSYTSAPVYTIQWTPENGYLDIYFDTDNSDPSDAILLASGVDANAGSYIWDSNALFPLGALPPGEYYIYIPGSGYSRGPLTVNKAPLIQILQPTPLTGEDYATSVVANPWDMDSSTDATPHNATNVNFTGGIFTASATNGDPAIHLNVTSPIDTSKYHWLSYSMRLPQTGSGVWNVSRILWQRNDSSPWQTADDVISWYDNGNGYTTWYTYTVDLHRVVLEPTATDGWTGEQTVLRIDPHETPIPPFFSIDWVKLTADDTADTSFEIRWVVRDSDIVITTLYYDLDTTWGNGEIFIDQVGPGVDVSPTPAGPYLIYLPIVSGGSGAPNGEEYTYRYAWDTTGIPAGTYYIWVEATDGLNTTRWVSESPVIISH